MYVLEGQEIDRNVHSLPWYTFPKPQQQTYNTFLDSSHNLFASKKIKCTKESDVKEQITKENRDRLVKAILKGATGNRLIGAILNGEEGKAHVKRKRNTVDVKEITNLRLRVNGKASDKQVI